MQELLGKTEQPDAEEAVLLKADDSIYEVLRVVVPVNVTRLPLVPEGGMTEKTTVMVTTSTVEVDRSRKVDAGEIWTELEIVEGAETVVTDGRVGVGEPILSVQSSS